MKIIWYGISVIVSIIVLVVLMFFAEINISDIVFALIGGVIVGLASGFYQLAKNESAIKIMKSFVFSIIGSAAGWFVAILAMKITTLSFYSVHAMVFTITVGAIGSFTAFLFQLHRSTDTKPEQEL